jgi:hypothetical protein
MHFSFYTPSKPSPLGSDFLKKPRPFDQPIGPMSEGEMH